MQLSVQNNDQAVAVIPHLLGFEPRESLVVVPVEGRNPPLARIDLPTTPDEAREVIATVAETYSSHQWGRVSALIVCFSDNPPATEPFSRELQTELEANRVTVIRRLAAGEADWIDFTTGTRGTRTAEARTLFDAEAAFAGRATPVGSREELAASFAGDEALIAEALSASRVSRDESTRELERSYCHAVVEQFHCDHERLQLGDAARLLVNLEIDPELFIRFAGVIRTSNAPQWLPLWKDLTAHAPDEVRAEPACLAALAAWCAGDGASAWSALDRIPAVTSESIAPIARLLRESLRTAAHPKTWDTICDRVPTSAGNPRSIGSGRQPASPAHPDRGSPGVAL